MEGNVVKQRGNRGKSHMMPPPVSRYAAIPVGISDGLISQGKLAENRSKSEVNAEENGGEMSGG